MNLALVGQFWAIAALLALVPGADWAYAISAGLRARSIVPAITGILAGYVVVVSVVAFGLGALVTRFPLALTILTAAGGFYLLWLGGNTLFRRAPAIALDEAPLADSGWMQFLRGFGVSGLNPKGLLLVVALLPQFTTPGGWPVWAQLLTLGSFHILDCAVIYATVAILARRLLRSRPRATVVITKIAGCAMILVGGTMLVERALTIGSG
ncbi:MAG TPA: LysE family translocator [Galbitalea sp.]|nr:LysE family translocator [Galbitalea sp.]